MIPKIFANVWQLRKVAEASQSSRTVPSDERGVLLEQIRNRVRFL
jgi:hypothetical protein